MNSAVFQPFHLHDLTLPNRIVLCGRDSRGSIHEVITTSVSR